MKICFITPSYKPIIGGTEIAIYEISLRLTKKGHKVFIITPQYPLYKDTKTHEIINGVEIYRVPVSPLAFRLSFITRYFDIQIKIFKKVFALNREVGFDLLHQFHLFALGGIAILSKKLFKKPLLTSLMGWDTYNQSKPVPKFLNFYLSWIMNNSDIVISPSFSLAEKAKIQGCKKPIKIIPHGVDIRRFKETTLLRLRNNLGINRDDLVVLSVQRLHPTKKLESLIKSISYVVNKRANVKFIIIGTGPERKKLEVLTRKLKMEDYIVFLGEVNNTELPEYYAMADIFVLHSLYESLGIVLLEAMASGKPIISTSVGAIPEVVEEGKTGILVPPENPKALAKGILELVNNKKLRQKMGKEGRKRAEKKYDWDKIINEYCQIYESLVK